MKPIKAFTIEAVTHAGAIRIQNRDAMLSWVAQVGDGIEIVGKLELAEETRSARASNYYWAVVLKMAAEHTGQLADDIHDVMCQMFLPDEHKQVEFFNRLTGDKLTVDVDKRRSSKLNRQQFYDFVEQVRVWMVEFLGVTTPDPDPEFWRKRAGKQGAA